MKRKLLSIVLTLSMVLSLLPSTVMADNNPSIKFIFQEWYYGQVKIIVGDDEWAYTADSELTGIEPGSMVEVEVTSKPGYRLTNYDTDIIMTDLKEDPDSFINRGNGKYSFTMPSSNDVIIQPKYEESYAELHIGNSPSLENGKVSVTIDGKTTEYTSQNTPATVSVRADSEALVQITPDHGNQIKFPNIIWDKTDPPSFEDRGNGLYYFKVPNGLTTPIVDISPKFEPAPLYSITTPDNIEGGTVTVQEKEAFSGDTVHVTASASEGYHLVLLCYRIPSEADEEPIDHENGVGTFEMPAADVELYAVFSQNTYVINTDDGIENGSLTILNWDHKPSEKSYYNDNVFVKVTPDDGYKFRTLTVTDKNGNSLETTDCADHDDEYTFKMPASDVTVSAEFVKRYGITLNPDSVVDNGSIDFPENAYEGDEVTLTVTPDNGYGVGVLEFHYLVDGDQYPNRFGQPVPNGDGTYTFTMPKSDVSIRCDIKKEHTIIVDAAEGHEEIAEAMSEQTGVQKVGYQIEKTDGTKITMKVFGDGRSEILFQAFYAINEIASSKEIIIDRIHNGERISYIGSKPLTDYKDKKECNADYNRDDMPEDGSVFYLHWEKLVKNVNVTVEAPACGTEVKFVSGYEYSGGTATSDPSPVITVEGDAVLFRSPFHNDKDGFWTDNEQGNWNYDSTGKGFFTGTMLGGEEYLVCFELEGKLGYYISEAAKNSVTVNGEAPVYISGGVVVAKIAVEHNWGGWTKTEPAATGKAGQMVRTCSVCGKTEKKEIPALTPTPTPKSKPSAAPTSAAKPTKAATVSLKLNKKTAEVVAGKSMILKATLKGSTSKITWKSSDKKIATVDANGKITSKMAGDVTITATAAGKSASCVVTVLYKDVTNSKDFWYVPTNYLTAKGVVKGYDKQTKFKPVNDCTRAQMVTFLYRLQGEPKVKSTTCKFKDVKKTDYFYKPVIWASEKGITTGVSKDKFGPQGVCTRAQTVTFLWRMANKPEPVTKKNKFPDVKKSDYFYKATLWASEKKILAGLPDGTFNPQGKCLRRQMVTFLYKYDKYVGASHK